MLILLPGIFLVIGRALGVVNQFVWYNGTLIRTAPLISINTVVIDAVPYDNCRRLVVCSSLMLRCHLFGVV